MENRKKYRKNKINFSYKSYSMLFGLSLVFNIKVLTIKPCSIAIRGLKCYNIFHSFVYSLFFACFFAVNLVLGFSEYFGDFYFKSFVVIKSLLLPQWSVV